MTRCIPVAILGCLALPGFSLADIVFTDATFLTGNYPTAFSFTHNDSTPGQIGTISDGAGPAQCACGDPGTALQTIFTISAAGNTNVQMDIGVINAGFVYDPGVQGTLLSVSGSVDESDNNSNPGFPPLDEFQIFIQQSGNFFYDNGSFISGSSGFNLLTSTNLNASAFDRIKPDGTTDFASHPDFNGAAMEFGLLILGGVLDAPANTETMVYDNLTLDLTPVPEPGSLLPVSAALAAIALLARTRRGAQDS